MQITYKYRLYPIDEQIETLHDWFDTLRHLWNCSLLDREQAYKERDESLSYIDQCKQLTQDRKQYPQVKAIPVAFARGTLKSLHLAFQSFFRQCENGEDPGYPNKKKHHHNISLVNRDAKGRTWIKDGDLSMPKLGTIPMVYHRPLPEDLEIAVATVKETAGKWYVTLSGDDGIPAPQQILPENAIGIDLGLTKLITLSNGETIGPPQYYKDAMHRLKKRQRDLSRKQKGSNNWKKQKRKVARAHHDIANARHTFIHNLSRELVDEYDVLVFEDLDIQDMVQLDAPYARQTSAMHRNMMDAAWGKLMQACEYKCKRAGKWFARVEPRGTTQECSRCGATVEKTLQDRIHDCPKCDLEMDRDVNAAINILHRGLEELGLCQSELTPVEMIA